MSDPQDPIRHLHQLVNERCRTCRDTGEDRLADFILWGRLFSSEYLGPKCYHHIPHIMRTSLHQLDQWAVVDLRPIRREVHNIEHDLEPARTGD